MQGSVDGSKRRTPFISLQKHFPKYLRQGICIHNISHNLYLILGLNCAYIFPGVGT